MKACLSANSRNRFGVTPHGWFLLGVSGCFWHTRCCLEYERARHEHIFTIVTTTNLAFDFARIINSFVSSFRGFSTTKLYYSSMFQTSSVLLCWVVSIEEIRSISQTAFIAIYVDTVAFAYVSSKIASEESDSKRSANKRRREVTMA